MNGHDDYAYSPSQINWIEGRKRTGFYVDQYISTSGELIVITYSGSTGYTFRSVSRRGKGQVLQVLSPRNYRMLYGDLPTHPNDTDEQVER